MGAELATYLFDDWAKIERMIMEAGRVILLSDYDGTLVPLAEKPELAIIPHSMSLLLKRLGDKNRVRIGIISGRPIMEIKKLSLKGAYYAGNHGFEIEGKSLFFSYPLTSELKAALALCCSKLKDKLEGVNGVWVEEKSFSISVHYRTVEEKDMTVVSNRLRMIGASFPSLKLTRGKMAYDFRPKVPWNKGKCAQL